jgi:hypothetical protein
MHALLLLEFLLFDGAALAWGGWELWSLRRSKWENPADSENAASGRSEDAPRHPEG